MSYWNLKVYDSDDGTERETLRGLTYARVNTLLGIFDREGIKAQAMEYNDEGSEMLDSRGVNLSHTPQTTPHEKD